MTCGDNVDNYIQHNGFNSDLTVKWVSRSLPSQTSGFCGQTVIADLDNDGWKDLLISDLNIDYGKCPATGTSDILRNGGLSVTDEAQRFSYASNQLGGLLEQELKGVFDFAVVDVNRDGCVDLVLGKCAGTQVWIQTSPGCDSTFPPPVDPPTDPLCADILANGVVDDADLGFLLTFYGDACTNGASCAADLNDDGVVNDADLGLLLSQYGLPCLQ